MQHAISSFMQTLRKGIFIICTGLLLIGGLCLFTQPSYAVSTPDEALQEIRRDQAASSREEAYETRSQITEDPKMGVEKEYEEEVEEYFEEHPEEGGIVEGAKQLINKATGKDE
ncbi:MAG: hypothetical protein Kow00121_08230 [Elainellaceae cyanobacterium]